MFEFISKFEFLQKLFHRDKEKTGQIARDRLRLVLIHDKSPIPPELMENLKYDLIKAIGNYLEIDEDAIEMGLERRDGTIALAANIPVLRVKRTTPVPEAVTAPAQKPVIAATVKTSAQPAPVPPTQRRTGRRRKRRKMKTLAGRS